MLSKSEDHLIIHSLVSLHSMQPQRRSKSPVRDAPYVVRAHTPSDTGLFALTAEGKFVTLPRITTSPLDHYGRVKRPGPGHADAYSVYEPYPWNESTDRAFGSHYATHSHVAISPNGHGYVIVASTASPSNAETLHSDNYYGATANVPSKSVRDFIQEWVGGSAAKVSHNSEWALTASTKQAAYHVHGVLFFKVPATLAFSSEVNISPQEIQQWKDRFVTM